METDSSKTSPDGQPATEIPSSTETRTHVGGDSNSGSGRLEVRCPICHEPMQVAVDTSLTDLTCSSCGSHFSLVDQSKATWGAPSLSTLGRFELVERIGVGGFGTVWKARDKQLDRVVALKVPRRGEMSEAETDKFFKEARAAAQLRHPNIVSVHEVGRDGDSVYIVSDFVRGVTLGDWLTGQQLTSREAAELCAKVADAVHHAHEHGVVHRDLKPANIMIDGDGQPHLMDFGLARREVGEVTVTMDGQVLGTPAYMSPEQAAGEAHTADRRSDVYSLGVILFQLLTGELPFRGNARMLVYQVLNDPPPSPRKFNANIPKDLETITLKCLEKDPACRYQTAEEFGSDLKSFLSNQPVLARPIGRVKRAWRWSHRNPAIAVLSVGFIGTLFIGLAATSGLWLKAEIARQQATAEAAKATAISGLLQKALQSANPDEAKGANYTVRQLLDDLSAGLGDQLKDQPEVEAAIRATIGNSYRRLGFLDKAERQLQTVLNMRTRIFGPKHVAVAQSHCDYAWCLYERRDARELEEAEFRVCEALAIHRKQGLQNGATVEMLGLLQLILNYQNQYAEANYVGREALKIAHQLPDQPPEVANILHRLAEAFLRKSVPDPVQAESYAQESVALHRQLQGDDHPETAWGLLNVAQAIEDQGKHDDAERCYREALTVFEKQYDDTHTSVQMAFKRLENVLTAKGDNAGLAALRAQKIERVKQAMRRDPTNVERQLAGAATIMEAGDISAAKAAYDDIIDKHPDEAKAWEFRGDCYLRNGEYAKAVEDYSQAIKLNPGEGSYWVNRASAHRMLQEYDRSITDYSKAIELGHFDTEQYFQLAHCYAEVEEWDKADLSFARAEELSPGWREMCWVPRALIRMAVRDDANYRQACATLVDLATYTSNDELGYAAADISVLTPDSGVAPQKIEAIVRRALESAPTNLGRRRLYGAALYRTGQFTEARRQLIECATASEKSEWDHGWDRYCLLYLAMADQRLDHHDEAQEWLDLAVQTIEEPTSRRPKQKAIDDWMHRVRVMNLRKETERVVAEGATSREDADGNVGKDYALVDLSKAIELTWRERRRSYVNSPKLEAAVADVSRVIELEPNYEWALYHRAWTYAALLQHEKAIVDYSKAIALRSDIAGFWLKRGESWAALGQAERAVDDFTQYIELIGNNSYYKPVLPYMLRGDGRLRLRRVEQALADYEEALRRDSSNAKIHCALAKALATNAEPTVANRRKAVDLAKMAIQLDPNDESSWSTLGMAQYRAGNWQAAIAALRKSLESWNGGNAADRFLVAMALQQLNKAEDARIWYEQAVVWTKKYERQDKELLRLRHEAEELFGRTPAVDADSE